MPLFKRNKPPETITVTEPEAEPLHHRFGFVHEVDPEFLRYMLERYEQQDGKFVRVGDIVLLAPLEERWGNNASKPQHNEFVSLALKSKNEDFKGRLLGAQAAAASGGELLDKAGVKDAGRFEFELGPDGEITDFTIFGWSNGYGGASPEARQETVEIVQQKLGGNTEVSEASEKETLRKMMR